MLTQLCADRIYAYIMLSSSSGKQFVHIKLILSTVYESYNMAHSSTLFRTQKFQVFRLSNKKLQEPLGPGAQDSNSESNGIFAHIDLELDSTSRSAFKSTFVLVLYWFYTPALTVSDYRVDPPRSLLPDLALIALIYLESHRP